MAKKTTTATASKRVSKKKPEELHQTHAALPSQPTVNMNKWFGIDDGYLDVSNLEEYKAKLGKMTITDLHDHCHIIGFVPLEPQDKLISMLEKRYQETKARQLPPKVFATPINPKFADFHRHFCADALK